MASDPLFRLIKSLSASEKAYIRRYALIHSEKGHTSQYIKLFDVLEVMKEYDEKLLHRKFAKDPINFISVSKNYLFNFILRNLENHSKSVKSEIRSCLNQAEILFEKGLSDPCRKKILKAETLARKYGILEQMYPVWAWKITQPWASMKGTDASQTIEDLYTEMKIAQEEMKESVAEDYDLYHIEVLCKNLGLARTEKDTLELENKLIELEKLNKKKFPSFASAFKHYQKLTILYETLNKPMKALVFSKKKLELLNSNLHMAEIQPYSTLYVTELEKVFNLEFSLGFYDQLNFSFETLNNLSLKNSGARKLMQVSLYSLKFSACMRTGKFETALHHSSRLRRLFSEMDFSETLESRKNRLNLECAVANFATKNYKAALLCLDDLQTGTASEINKDVYYFSQILQVLIYFEKGDIELVLYRTRAAYRTLYRHNKLHRIEKFLLDFLKKENAEGWDKKVEKQIFTKLQSDLQKLFKEYPDEKKLLLYFDLPGWIESRIEKISLSQVLETRLHKLYGSSSGKDLIKSIAQD
jgi:hypothetical protein